MDDAPTLQQYIGQGLEKEIPFLIDSDEEEDECCYDECDAWGDDGGEDWGAYEMNDCCDEMELEMDDCCDELYDDDDDDDDDDESEEEDDSSSDDE
eukprot:1154875_1